MSIRYATSCRRRFLFRVATVVAGAILVCAAPVSAVPPSGPALSVSARLLEAAVTCDSEVASRRAVLLVHGTGTNSDESWSWGYARALSAAGFAVCTVDLPGRSVISVYDQSEYVVYAIRKARALSHQKIAVIGHSQGGSHPLWAMKFWPDTRTAVDDYIGLAPGVGGTRLGNILCSPGACPEIAWQVRFGSRYLTRLHEGGLPEGPSYTSIYTTLDEAVFPQPDASAIPGGSNVSIQSVCPARFVEHGTILADGAAWALAVDALTHAGPADPSRVTTWRTVCREQFLPHIDVGRMAAKVGGGLVSAAAALLSRPFVTSEPELPGYAR